MNKINSVKIKLIIGLGNPGEEYENTRHNTGFLFINELAHQSKAPDFKYEKKLFSEITEAQFPIFNFQFSNKSQISSSKNKFKITLARPLTFMNKSGIAVAALMKFYPPAGDLPKGDKIKPANILIVHDDIDILWGNFKLSFGRSSAGHKGVESIIKTLKTKDFWRLRVGIQPKQTTNNKQQTTKIKADKIILKKFTAAEEKTLKSTIKSAIKQIEEIL